MLQTSSKTHKYSSVSVLHLITDYRLLITPLALALSGCMGVYEGGFECPPGKGVGCKSISEVNDLINKGDLAKRDHPEPLDCECQDPKSTDARISNAQAKDEEQVWIAPWAFEGSI